MKKGIDLLHGSIFRSLSLLAIPIMSTYLIQMAYNLVDMLWIGRLGATAVASVGIAGNFMYLANGLVNMPKVGAQALVGQSLGAGNYQKARDYMRNALQITLFFGILFGLVMICFQDQLISFFRLSDPKVISDAKWYLIITCGLVVFSFINQTLTGILTSAGFTKTTFLATFCGLILNIILDPIFIFVLHLGVAGAAWATILSQIVVFFVFLYSCKQINLFDDFHLIRKPNPVFIKDLLKIGFPASLQSMLFTSISMIIARLVASYGDAIVGVQKVGSQIESISWMIADGFSASLSAFTSQNYGAKNMPRVKQGYHTGILIVSIWGIFTSCVLIFLAGPIFQCFITEADMLSYGKDYLIILGFSQLFMCMEIATQGAFNGLGKTIPPSVVSIIFTSARVPMAIYFCSFMGVNGIWWAITVSSIIKGILLVSWYLIESKKMLKESS